MNEYTAPSPRVSVLVTTYNHAPYIEQCLDSILRQKTNFPFEIILGEDGSDDGTQEICKKYASAYPSLIRLSIRDQAKKVFLYGRATGKYNLLCTLQEATGEYLAFCDGDDYWTDDLKLQKQVDLLDTQRSYSFCATDRMTLKDGEIKRDERLKAAFDASGNQPIEINKNNFFSPYLVKTNVILFRRSALDFNLLKVYFKEVKDTFIYFMLLDHGKGIIQPWMTSVYRIHPGGRWSSINRFQKARLNHFCVKGMFDSYLGKAPSLQVLYKNSLSTYFSQSVKNYQWKDAWIAVSENPVVCLGRAASRFLTRYFVVAPNRLFHRDESPRK